jgi:hypothetical protein
VAKRQRRLTGVDDLVISLSAKGLTHGEIAAHLAEVYGAEVSKQAISMVTDWVLEGMGEWQNRPLDLVYPVIEPQQFRELRPYRVPGGLVRKDPVQTLAFELTLLVLVQRAHAHVPDLLSGHRCLQTSACEVKTPDVPLSDWGVP